MKTSSKMKQYSGWGEYENSQLCIDIKNDIIKRARRLASTLTLDEDIVKFDPYANEFIDFIKNTIDDIYNCDLIKELRKILEGEFKSVHDNAYKFEINPPTYKQSSGWKIYNKFIGKIYAIIYYTDNIGKGNRTYS